MTIFQGLRSSLCIAVLALSACANYSKLDESRPIGTLGVVGNAVTLNDKPGSNGAPIYAGDRVATGAASSAIIDFVDGGYFQLDQNTDPLFVIQRLEAGVCILASLLVGQVFVDKPRFCLDTPDIQAINNSRINVKVVGGQTVLTVAQGHVTVLHTDAPPVTAGQQLLTAPQTHAITVRNLDANAVETVMRWRHGYQFQGWCCRDGAVIWVDRADCSGKFSFNKAVLEKSCVDPPTLDFRDLLHRQQPRPRPRGDSPGLAPRPSY